MVDQVGLIVQGDENNNNLTVNVVHEENDDLSIYNIIYAGDGNDTLSGRPLDDDEIITQYGVQLFGEGGNDNLSGSLGNDTLSGGAGNDRIFMTAGYDIIDGGEGTDTLRGSYRGLLDSQQLSVSGVERLTVLELIRVGDFDLRQFDVIYGDIGDSIIKFSQRSVVEDVRFEPGGLGKDKFLLLGSDFGDSFDLSTSTCHFEVEGGNGDDNIIGGQGINNIDGRDGNDIIAGGQKRDWLVGGDGDDVIFGGAGRDVILDKDGNNTIHGGNDADDISASDGNSRLYGDGGNDKIHVSNGSFVVNAGDGDDALYASGGTKTGFAWKFHGGKGEDTLYAKGNLSNLKVDGIEYLALTDPRPKLTIDADTLDNFDRLVLDYRFAGMQINFSSGGTFKWQHTNHEEGNSSRLIGSEEKDRIYMNSSTNNWTINGGGGDDVISGGRGNDFIHGGDGDDVLIASGGHDSFWGDAGKDTYIIKNGGGMVTFAHYDNSGADRDIIDLSAFRSIKSFDDLLYYVNEDLDGVMIWLGDCDIQIYGVSEAQLDESAFIF